MAFFPAAVATTANLYTAVNSLQTTLATGLGTGDVSVVLSSSTGFPTAGAVTIDNEVIFYTGISGATLTGCTRGADGTTAATHSVGVPVGAAIVAFHHNGLMTEVIAIETYLNTKFGASGSAYGTAKALQTNASTGIPEVSSVTNTELGYLSGVTSAIQTQFGLKAPLASPTFTGTVTTAGIAMGSNKITGLANGTASTDAAAFGQVKVLQIVFGSSTTDFTTTSSTFQTTNCSATITPTSSSSRILVLATGTTRNQNVSVAQMYLSLFRDSTNLGGGSLSAFLDFAGTGISTNAIIPGGTMATIDSPASTSAITYSVKIMNNDNATTIGYGNGTKTTMILIEVV